jgi:hypothetical protein
VGASGAGIGKQVSGWSRQREEALVGEVKSERRRKEKLSRARLGPGLWVLDSGLRLKEREAATKPFCAVLEPPDLRIQFCATSSRSCAVYKHQTGLDWTL